MTVNTKAKPITDCRSYRSMFALRNDPTAIDIATNTISGVSMRDGLSRVPAHETQPTAITANRIGTIFEIELEDRFSI